MVIYFIFMKNCWIKFMPNCKARERILFNFSYKCILHMTTKNIKKTLNLIKWSQVKAGKGEIYFIKNVFTRILKMKKNDNLQIIKLLHTKCIHWWKLHHMLKQYIWSDFLMNNIHERNSGVPWRKISTGNKYVHKLYHYMH